MLRLPLHQRLSSLPPTDQRAGLEKEVRQQKTHQAERGYDLHRYAFGRLALHAQPRRACGNPLARVLRYGIALALSEPLLLDPCPQVFDGCLRVLELRLESFVGGGSSRRDRRGGGIKG